MILVYVVLKGGMARPERTPPGSGAGRSKECCTGRGYMCIHVYIYIYIYIYIYWDAIGRYDPLRRASACKIV